MTFGPRNHSKTDICSNEINYSIFPGFVEIKPYSNSKLKLATLSPSPWTRRKTLLREGDSAFNHRVFLFLAYV